MKTVRLCTCNSQAEAYIIKGKLETENIPSFLTNEHFFSMKMFGTNNFNDGIGIMVRETDLEAAQMLLHPGEKKLICPKCESENLGLKYGKGNSFWFFQLMLSLFFALIPIQSKQYWYCRDCGHQFENIHRN
jgi:Zn finger protein HypA/HybF involved in hydrogenase expression